MRESELNYSEVPRKVWTRQEAHLLFEGSFPNAQRFELVVGELIDPGPKNPRRVLWRTLVRAWLISIFGVEFVRSESPTDVASEDNPISEPEPDLLVTPKSVREYSSNPSPQDALLVIEVSDSTVRFDLTTKARLYARAGMIEYWVVSIPDKQLVVHRHPVNGIYTSVVIYESDQDVSPLARPDAVFRLDRL